MRPESKMDLDFKTNTHKFTLNLKLPSSQSLPFVVDRLPNILEEENEDEPE